MQVSRGIRDILGQSLGDTSLMYLHWPEFTVGVFYLLNGVTFRTWQTKFPVQCSSNINTLALLDLMFLG